MRSQYHFFHRKIVLRWYLQCETNFVSHDKFAESRSIWYFKAQTNFEKILVQNSALHTGNTSVKKIKKRKKGKNSKKVSLKSKLAMAVIRRNRAEIVRLDSRLRRNGSVLAILHSFRHNQPFYSLLLFVFVDLFDTIKKIDDEKQFFVEYLVPFFDFLRLYRMFMQEIKR